MRVLLQLGVGDTVFLHRTDMGEYVFPWTIFLPPPPPADSASGQPQSTTVAEPGGEVPSVPAPSRSAAMAAAEAAPAGHEAHAATAAAARKVGGCKLANAVPQSAICNLAMPNSSLSLFTYSTAAGDAQPQTAAS